MKKIKELLTKKMPEIKRERVSGEKVERFKIKDSKGVDHDAKKVSFTEKEIENTHLVKIAPLFYYCTDNNKVLMVPFTLQFSVEEVLRLCAGIATNIGSLMNKKSKK